MTESFSVSPIHISTKFCALKFMYFMPFSEQQQRLLENRVLFHNIINSLFQREQTTVKR